MCYRQYPASSFPEASSDYQRCVQRLLGAADQFQCSCMGAPYGSVWLAREVTAALDALDSIPEALVALGHKVLTESLCDAALDWDTEDDLRRVAFAEDATDEAILTTAEASR